MGESTMSDLPTYHAHRYGDFGVGSNKYVVETIYAGRLGYVAAEAPAAAGGTDKWQGVQMIPLDDNDEIHFGWYTPHNFNHKAPIYVRFGVFETATDDTLDIALTFDRVSVGSAGADGATAVTDTIPQVTGGVAYGVSYSYWAKINGTSTAFDLLFLKAIATINTADQSKVWCMQIAYSPLTAS